MTPEYVVLIWKLDKKADEFLTVHVKVTGFSLPFTLRKSAISLTVDTKTLEVFEWSKNGTRGCAVLGEINQN